MELIFIIICILAMISASIFDIRYREIPDIHWFIIGATGVVAMLWSHIELPWILMTFGCFLYMLEMLTDLIPEGKFLLLWYIAATSLFAAAAIINRDTSMTAISIPVCICLFRAFYQFGILNGGADAKALMSLSMAFPIYPVGYSLLTTVEGSIQALFPISILFLATVITMASALPIAMSNIIKKKDLAMRNLLLVRKRVSDVRTTHCWIRQDIVDGELTYVKDADESALDRLKAHGLEYVYVSPAIPFIVPITLSLVFCIFVIDPIMLPFML